MKPPSNGKHLLLRIQDQILNCYSRPEPVHSWNVNITEMYILKCLEVAEEARSLLLDSQQPPLCPGMPETWPETWGLPSEFSA